MCEQPLAPSIALIGGAIQACRSFASAVKGGVPRVKAGSQAEADQQVSGNQVIPHLIVSGLIGSVADHLSAWAELADSPEEDDKVLLHLAADYTLLRPVIEGLVEVIWVLDGATSEARIKRAMEIAKIEYVHGTNLTNALTKAGMEDTKTVSGVEALGRMLRECANSIGVDPDKFLSSRAIDPSSITKKVASRISGPTLRTFRYWAITSAHAHGQLISTLRFAQETPLGFPHNGGSYYAPDEELLAELLQFVSELINVAVTDLNSHGYELVTS